MKQLIIILFVISLFGCKKETVTPAKGDAGAAGTSDVHSYSYITTSTDWVQQGGYYVLNKYIPEIDQHTLNNGTVQVFIEDVNQNYFALPYTKQGIEYLYSIKLYGLEIDILTGINPGTQQLKVVIIPGA